GIEVTYSNVQQAGAYAEIDETDFTWGMLFKHVPIPNSSPPAFYTTPFDGADLWRVFHAKTPHLDLLANPSSDLYSLVQTTDHFVVQYDYTNIGGRRLLSGVGHFRATVFTVEDANVITEMTITYTTAPANRPIVASISDRFEKTTTFTY